MRVLHASISNCVLQQHNTLCHTGTGSVMALLCEVQVFLYHFECATTHVSTVQWNAVQVFLFIVSV